LFGHSFELAWEFIDVAKVYDFDFLGIGRVVEAEVIGDDRTADLEVPDLDAVLRRLINSFRRDDIATWIGLIPLSNPNLPVNLLCPKGKMVTFFARCRGLSYR
jgi:hypothetical protein